MSKPGKSTVQLPAGATRPSKIRRDPALVAKPDELGKNLWWRSSEWEIRFAILGIIAFALAINVIIIAISAYWK